MRLIRRIPAGVIAVAESGIDTPGILVRLRACGFRAFLIGGCLMSRPDPGRALGELLRDVESRSAVERGGS